MRVSNRASTGWLVAGFIFVGLLALGGAQPAAACGGPVCCGPWWCPCCWVCSSASSVTAGVIPPGETTVHWLSPRRALLEIKFYETMEMEQESFECAVAFPPIEGVDRVNRVSMIDTVTGQPVEQRPWTAHPAPGPGFAALATEAGLNTPAKGWTGFVSSFNGPTKGGQMFNFLVDLTLKPGTRVEDFLAALHRNGVVANGSAHPDGTLDLHHYFLRPFGQGSMELDVRSSKNTKPDRPRN